MSYSAAQRWTLRLAGEDKPVCLTFIHTQNKLIKSVVSLRLRGTDRLRGSSEVAWAGLEKAYLDACFYFI